MKKILTELEFASIISEAQAQTATGAALLNSFKSHCMSNESTCALVNNFIKEASKLTYDNGVVAVLEEVADFVNTNKTRWQIASACESIQSQQTSYNVLNLNAAKQAEKLIDLNEDEAVKYIKAGAFKNIMFCEAFRSIAKSVFKNQTMVEANAEYTTVHPVSIVEKTGDDLYFEVAGNLYKLNEDNQVSAANWNEVSNAFKNVTSILESNLAKCCDETLLFKVNNTEYQISEANTIVKLSKETEKEMTVEQFREDSRLMVNATNPRFRNEMARVLECIAQVSENFDRIVSLDNASIIESKNDKFILVECGGNVFATLLKSTHNPQWTINEGAMKAVDFIKSKTRIDLTEKLNEAIKTNISNVSEEEKRVMEQELEDKEIQDVKDRIAALTEKYKDDPAKLAVLASLSESLMKE
jgi:hypothetical protein